MRRLRTAITTFACAAGLSLGLAAIAPAQAAGPAANMNQARAALAPIVNAAPVIQAQAGHVSPRYRDRRYRHRHWRGPRQYQRRHHHRRHYRSGPGFYFHFGSPPRRYAPPPRRTHRLPASHVRWCHNRYRSYRASDNTFQPYNGPRRQCRSPYI
ncbi:MAG: BA14K family protein [Rhizobiaceae bacterium]